MPVNMVERPPLWLQKQAAPLGIPPRVKRLFQKIAGTRHTFNSQNMVVKVHMMLLLAAPLITRDLHCVELPSGWGEISYTARIAGYMSHEYDRYTRHEQENFCTPLGLFWAGILVLRCKKKGLVVFEPECSTWCFLNSFTSGRYINIWGDLSRQQTLDANLTAQAIGMLMVLASVRQVYYIFERPTRSCMSDHPAMSMAIELTKGVKIHTFLGGFNHPMPKPTVLTTTIPLAKAHSLKRPQPANMEHDDDYTRDSCGWTCGGKKLKSSEHYPSDFCAEIVAVLDRCQE